jgi:putative DNA primase/helicase
MSDRPSQSESANVARLEEAAARRRAAVQQSSAPAAPDARQPMMLAQAFRARYEVDGQPGLLFHSGRFLRCCRSHWVELSRGALKAAAYGFLDEAGAKANRHAVGDLLDALEGICYAEFDLPGYRPGVHGGDPADLVPVLNGLLHVPTRTLYPHDPAFVALSCAPVAWEPDAQAPRWREFIEAAIPNEAARIAFQMFLALLLLSKATRYQKALMLIGPPRSGKGTIFRLLTRLLGQHAIAAPMLSQLGGRFGPAALLGKSAALISDARLPPGGEGAAALEMILRITGEDAVTVERKFGEPLDVRLPCRLVLASNELPLLLDASGAAASRFIVVRTGASHVGAEDLGLDDALAAEAPGILVWAMDGWAMLQHAGRFSQPEDGQALLDELRDSGSPMLAFLRERCVLDPKASTPKSVLFDAWRDWCRDAGRMHPGNDSTFARSLMAATPGVVPVRPRDDARRRYQAFAGIRMVEAPGP